MKFPDPPVGELNLVYLGVEMGAKLLFCVGQQIEVLTCVVHVGASVESWGAAGLDLPPGASVL